MAIVYMVTHPCRAKEELPDGGLMRLIQGRDPAKVFLAHVGSAGGPLPLTATRLVRTPDGAASEQQIRVDDEAQRTAVLAELEPGCEGCPARLTGAPFSCCGTISYPILTATEEWLLSRLPDDHKGRPARGMRSLIDGNKFDGAFFGEVRGQKTFYQSPKPQVRKWGGFLSKWQLSADQVMEMLSCYETIEADHCALLTFWTGVLPHDSEPSFWGNQEAQTKVLSAARAEFPRDGGQIEAMGWYLEGLRVCAALGVPMALDV